MTIDLQDVQAERELVSQLLVAPFQLRTVLVQERLTGEHFTEMACRCLFEALVKIRDRGDQPSETLLIAELGRDPRAHEPRTMLDQAQGWLYGTDTVALCCELTDRFRRRQLRQAASLIADAALEDDSSPKLAEAERLLTQPEAGTQTSWTPAELRDLYFDQFQEGTVEAFPYEFERINDWTGGGIRRGEYVLVGGWGAHGKSAYLDQMLERWAAQDLKVHLYINEMTRAGRVDRTVARLSGVAYRRVRSRKLIDGDDKKILKSLDGIKVGITDCAGWTAHEIARHIRWNKWDIAGVDILHQISHDDERGIAQISQVMRSTALQTGTALVCTVHLNDARVVGVKHPVPVARDIRMSGMLWRDCDTCFFVHRDEDDDGLPTNTGVLVAAKVRDGEPSLMKVLFNTGRMRFEPATLAAVGSVADIPAARSAADARYWAVDIDIQ